MKQATPITEEKLRELYAEASKIHDCECKICGNIWIEGPDLETILHQREIKTRKDMVEKIIKHLINIRDIEMEGRKDLMKTRAGYNVNLLIDDLLQQLQEEDGK